MALEDLAGQMLAGIVVAVFTALLGYRAGETRGRKSTTEDIEDIKDVLYGHEGSDMSMFQGLIDVIETHDDEIAEMKDELDRIDSQLKEIKSKCDTRNGKG